MSYAWPPTLDDVKDELNKLRTADDAELLTVIDRAVAILENHPDYAVADFVREVEHTERPTPFYDDGKWKILLRHRNVDLSSVVVREWSGGVSQVIAYEPLTAGTYTAYGWDADDNGEAGILYRTSSGSPARWGGTVVVTYTTGVTDVPADLWGAVLELVDHLWEDQRGGGTVRPMVGMDPDFDREVIGRANYLLPNRVAEALTPYRREPALG